MSEPQQPQAPLQLASAGTSVARLFSQQSSKVKKFCRRIAAELLARDAIISSGCGSAKAAVTGNGSGFPVISASRCRGDLFRAVGCYFLRASSTTSTIYVESDHAHDIRESVCRAAGTGFFICLLVSVLGQRLKAIKKLLKKLFYF